MNSPRSTRLPDGRAPHRLLATPPTDRPPLTLRRLWQAVGWLLVGLVILLTLIPKPPQPPLITWDKAQHLLAYSILMLWFAQTFARRFAWPAFLMGLGIALEFVQGWSGLREFEYQDMLANALGVVAGRLLAATALGRTVGWLDRRLAGWWRGG
jgi:VanZ family protein